MDPADWQSLRDAYLSNQYYAANITIDGVTLRQVGIRSRGDYSRNAAKPGLKVNIDKYLPDQEWNGYRALVLNSDIQDYSSLRECLAFQVFEAMGIAAPRLAHARLTVNGEYWGVYTMVEAVTKPFLKARFGENGGNLFDYEWTSPYWWDYRGADPTNYVPGPFQPQTNEDHLDPTGLIELIRSIGETPNNQFLAVFESHMSVRHVMDYIATENAMAEIDGFLGEWGTNNFYLYQYKEGQRFVLIPWDKDTSFKTENWPLFDRTQKNIITRRLLAIPEQRQAYQDAVKRAVTEFVNEQWLIPRLEARYALIRAAVLADNKKPYRDAKFEDDVAAVRQVIRLRKANVLERIAKGDDALPRPRLSEVARDRP
jgi:spore coat protein CotH